MKPSLPRNLILVLIGLAGINLLQASFTELIYDEAYYWYYAQQPAWGYFDHPPMVAWMIAAGGWILPGEAGVRLISCLLGAGTLYLLWLLVDRPGKQGYLPQLLVWFLSIPLLHAYGFLSLPDTPLLFFTALFFWVYKRFLESPGTGRAMLLGLVMAALMYSKYHAALIILFVLFSNLRLLRSRYAWIALFVSLLSYAPHLAWLYGQDFVSVKYHLFERPNQPYQFWKFTGGYVVNLIVLFGLCFPWVYRCLWQFRAADLFERALKFTAWGILVFFLISSFQRRVQTQWLIAACIPLAILVGTRIVQDERLRTWVWRASLANLAVLFFLRLGLMYEPLFPVRYESHGNRAWVGNLKELAAGAPVVFENSYRQASMYQFYSGQPAFSLNNAMYRKNQYSIDGSEARVQGKRIFHIPVVNRETPYHYTGQDGEPRYGTFMDPFKSYRRVEAGLISKQGFDSGTTAVYWAHNPYPEAIPLERIRFGIALLDRYKRTQTVLPVHPEKSDLTPESLAPGDSLRFSFRIPDMARWEPAYLRAVLSQKPLYWGLNGQPQKIKD